LATITSYLPARAALNSRMIRSGVEKPSIGSPSCGSRDIDHSDVVRSGYSSLK
jgi:hypothetical protein